MLRFYKIKKKSAITDKRSRGKEGTDTSACPCEFSCENSYFTVRSRARPFRSVFAERIGSTAEPATAGEELCDELRRLERKRNAGKPGFWLVLNQPKSRP